MNLDPSRNDTSDNAPDGRWAAGLDRKFKSMVHDRKKRTLKAEFTSIFIVTDTSEMLAGIKAGVVRWTIHVLLIYVTRDALRCSGMMAERGLHN